MDERTEPIRNLSSRIRKPTYYEILGVPIGASIDHVKDSYRLLTKRSPITAEAYDVLTDPTQRDKYDSDLLREKTTARDPEQEGDYFVGQDDAGWHIVADKDLGWELHSFLSEGRIRLSAPTRLLGPFSRSEAREVAAKKRLGEAESGDRNDETGRSWTELGAPSEMPQKPVLPTHTELYYIAGMERIIRAEPQPTLVDRILDYTPEQLLEASGISLETQNDLDFYIQYVQWLSDLVTWLKSLPEDLATKVAEGLQTFAEGRYRFMTPLLQH